MSIERTCGNCACYFEIPNPANKLEAQGFCRRSTVNVQQVRVEVPRLDPAGKPVVSKINGQPLTDARPQLAYIHGLTQKNLVCFDGWRPIGTRPGETSSERHTRQALDSMLPLAQAAGAGPEVLELVRKLTAAYLADEPAAANEPSADAPPPGDQPLNS